MIIKTISTGSKEGNCFLIDDGHTQLLLDCGVSVKKIQQALDFKLRQIQGCLITHRHGDHVKGLKGLLDKGIKCYIGTKEKDVLNIDNHRFYGIEPLEQFQIGTWIILPFHVEHDTEQPLGYLIQSTVTNEKILFATDTYYIRYHFKGVTHMLIECNHSRAIVFNHLNDGSLPKFRAERVLKSHFALENVVNFLNACDLSNLQEIRLIHLSDQNSNEDEFQTTIQKATGVPVFVER